MRFDTRLGEHAISQSWPSAEPRRLAPLVGHSLGQGDGRHNTAVHCIFVCVGFMRHAHMYVSALPPQRHFIVASPSINADWHHFSPRFAEFIVNPRFEAYLKLHIHIL